VHGSVLVIGRTVYFAAGYTSYLDGGLWLWGLDAATGAVKYKATLSTEGTSQDGAMPDVDGRTIGMRFRRFDLSLGRVKASRPAMLATGAGLLDDCWGHRDRWNWTLGAGDTFGELLVFDGKTAYGVQSYYTFLKHDRSMQPATHTGHLHQKYARYTPGQFPIQAVCPGKQQRRQARRTEQAPADPGRQRPSLEPQDADSIPRDGPGR